MSEFTESDPKYKGIWRILLAGKKHSMPTEAVVASKAMALELDKATNLTVCFDQFDNPVKDDSAVLRKCPNKSMDAFKGIVGVTGEPCEATLRHDKDGNYVCTGNYCRKTYARTEIDKDFCTVCGETLWRRPLPVGGNQFDFDYVCLVSGEVYPRNVE